MDKVQYYITPLNGIIKVQILEVTSVWFSGTMWLLSKRKVGVFQRYLRKDLTDTKDALVGVATDKRSVESLKRRSEEIIFFANRERNACHQNLDRIDEMIHIPGA